MGLCGSRRLGEFGKKSNAFKTALAETAGGAELYGHRHLQVFDQLPLGGLFGRLSALTVLEEVVQVLILDGFETNMKKQNKTSEHTQTPAVF